MKKTIIASSSNVSQHYANEAQTQQAPKQHTN